MNDMNCERVVIEVKDIVKQMADQATALQETSSAVRRLRPTGWQVTKFHKVSKSVQNVEPGRTSEPASSGEQGWLVMLESSHHGLDVTF